MRRKKEPAYTNKAGKYFFPLLMATRHDNMVHGAIEIQRILFQLLLIQLKIFNGFVFGMEKSEREKIFNLVFEQLSKTIR